MSKTLKMSNLSGASASRALLAISLSAVLAVLGCTTDRNLGNGDPVTTPGVRTSPTSGASTPGSETAPTIPPAMTSASTFAEPLPAVQARSIRRLTPDEAAAIIAQHQPRVRYLGVVDPGPANRGVSEGLVTGQFQNPALRTNPQLTINSSISSGPTVAVSSGAGEGVAGGGGAIVGGATIAGTGVLNNSTVGTGVVNNSTLANGGTLNLGGNVTANGTATGGPIIGAPSAGSLSPTGAAIPLPAGSFATTGTGTLTPTASSSLNPPTTISSFPALATTTAASRAATGRTNTNLSNGTTTGGAITASSTSTGTATTNSGNIVNPVRIMTGPNGRRVITNVSTRNQ